MVDPPIQKPLIFGQWLFLTIRVNQLWQTDFTYFKVIGWGWFYLSTVLDDYSSYIIAWRLCTTMQAADVTQTLEVALRVSGFLLERFTPKCTHSA